MSDSRNEWRADARVEELVRGSVVYRAADRVISIAEAAWRASSAHALLSGTGGDRVRFRAGVALVAALTALALAPLGTTPRPLAWVVPVVTAALATIVLIVDHRARPVD